MFVRRRVGAIYFEFLSITAFERLSLSVMSDLTLICCSNVAMKNQGKWFFCPFAPVFPIYVNILSVPNLQKSS